MQNNNKEISQVEESITTTKPEVKVEVTAPVVEETKTEKTFTQDEVNSFLAKEKAKNKAKQDLESKEKLSLEEQVKGLAEREEKRELEAQIAIDIEIQSKKDYVTDSVAKFANEKYLTQAMKLVSDIDVVNMTKEQIEAAVEKEINSISGLSKKTEAGIASSTIVQTTQEVIQTTAKNKEDKIMVKLSPHSNATKEMTREEYDKLPNFMKL